MAAKLVSSLGLLLAIGFYRFIKWGNRVKHVPEKLVRLRLRSGGQCNHRGYDSGSGPGVGPKVGCSSADMYDLGIVTMTYTGKNSLRQAIWLTGLVTLLSACDDAGGGGGNSDSASDAGLGANAIELPQISGHELVSYIEPADLDEDGRTDLIMFLAPDGYYGDRKYVALMNEASGFVVDESYFDGTFTGEPWVESVDLVDINGDGHKDIVPYQDGQPDTQGPLVWNNTSNRFEEMPDAVFDSGARGYVAIDADEDADLDLLTHDWNTGRWGLIRNNGGSFVQGPDPLFNANTESSFVYHPVVMDVNNDGRDDLIFGGPKYDDGWVDEKVPLTVMLNQSGGWTQADNGEMFSGETPSFTHLRVTRTADFNNDGYTDIAVASHGYDSGGLPGEYNGVLLNTISGGFEVDTTSEAVNYKGFTHAMAVGDIDRDGDVDIIYVDITGEDTNYRSAIRILYNDGTGEFTHEVATLSHDFGMNKHGGWTAAALADLDNDGYLDLVVGGQGSDAPSFVFYNDGNGYFR